MSWHPARIGYSFLIATATLVGTSLAIDRTISPTPHPQRNAQQRAQSSFTDRSISNRATNTGRLPGRSAGIDDWETSGAWSSVEKQILNPVEKSSSRLTIPEGGALRIFPPTSSRAPSIDDQRTPEPDSPNGDDSKIDSEAEGDTGEANKDDRPNDGPAEVEGDPLPPDLVALRTKIGSVLTHYRTRQLNTRDHTPWEMMHAFVAFNTKTEVRRDGPNGPAVNAIGWMLWGGRCRGQQLLTLQRGRPHGEEGVGVQGHPAQLLAILAQSRVSARTPMRIGGKSFTLQDLIDEEMLDCRADTELTFKLISFAHYLESDAVWRSRDGQSWSIPRLINAEIKAPIRGAPCGGAHRLFGITYAYQMREREGRPIDGEFLRAKQYITSYQRYTWSLQNPDGSFSTEWFSRRGNRPDVDRKIQTSGHILEWLIFSLSDEQLREPRTVKAVNFIATSLANEPNRVWSIGPLGHALHALVMYDERIFGHNDDLPGTGTLTTDSSSGSPDVATDVPVDDDSKQDSTANAAQDPSDETASRLTPGPVFPGLKY